MAPVKTQKKHQKRLLKQFKPVNSSDISRLMLQKISIRFWMSGAKSGWSS